MSTQTPMTNIHTEAAQAFIDKLRELQQTVPNFTIPEAGEGQRLANSASLPGDFIELAVTATKNSADLVRGGATDPDQVRDLMSFAEAYGPVVAELTVLTKFMKHTVRAARSKAGTHALTTYSLAKRLSKRRETSYLAPVAQLMREKLGKRRRPAKPQTDPTTPPAPHPPSTGTSPK